jgi:hypothetical protein
MTEPTITCPNCKAEIKLTESLAAPVIESTRRQYEQQLAQKDVDIAKREQAMREKETQIAEARRATTTALTLEEKLAGQKQIKALEAQRNQKRRSLFDAQDQVDKQREELIAQIEGKLTQLTSLDLLFHIQWAIR